MHVGTVEQLVELYRKGLWLGQVDDELKQINPHLQWSFDDQLFSVIQYLERDDIVVDGNCYLCQSMQAPALQSSDIGFTPDFVVNIKKNTRPVFVHGHGNVQIKEIYDSVVKRYGY